MPIRFLRAGFMGLAVTAFLATGAAAIAEEMKFKADLKGSEEVPPVMTDATGTADVTYDSDAKALAWRIEYSGLSGEATAGHFHGPAGPGKNAPPVVGLDVGPSPIEGSIEVTEEQAAALEDLTAERWYLNIHTAEHPQGEIRGQVTKAE
jgi:hypothetical protein